MRDRATIDSYFRDMYPDPAPNAFSAWKRGSTGVAIARRLWHAQQFGVANLPRRDVEEHRVLGIWVPDMWTRACADCSWLGWRGEPEPPHATEPVLAVVSEPYDEKNPNAPAYSIRRWTGPNARPRRRR